MKDLASAHLLAIGFLSLCCPACDDNESSPASTTANQEAVRLGIKSSPASIITTELPAQLTDANWGVKEIACSEGGYDLDACAGQSVTLTSFPTSEQRDECALDLWVVSKDTSICCAYKAVGQGCTASPGVYPIRVVSASAKRKAPDEVAPVTSENVRYEAPHFDNPCASNGGCIVAYDNTSNAVLWSVQVYCTPYDANLESDVQDVFITALSLEDGQLRVTNEKNQTFLVSTTTTHTVTGDERGCP